MNSHIIETRNVSRSFGGSVAVRDLNLRVRRGSLYGFLGRSGAGKTTTIKMLAGLIWPDAGEIRVNGGANRPDSPSRIAGKSATFPNARFCRPECVSRR